jgi:hypothetical protein
MGKTAMNPIALMLAKFLNRSDQKTILIRGAWGVGKTFAVSEFVEQFDFKSANGLVARSRVSLFGKQSMSEVQREIFALAKQVASDEVTRDRLGVAAHKLIQLEQYLNQNRAQRSLRWLSSKMGQVQLPWVGDLGAMVNQGNFGLVDGFLVTVDDLERRSSNLSLKDALGLVDELASSRNCKVIVICNEDALDDSDREFLADYKEKVFDLELLFSRSPREIAEIGLPSSCSHRAISVSILEKLGISNIRVVKRYAFLVDQVWTDLKSADSRVVQEVLEHIAILTWARYDSTAGIPTQRLGQLASESFWMASAFRDRDAPKEEWQVSWDAAVAALEFSSEEYDKVLVEYLRTGIWLPGDIASEIEAKSENLRRLEATDAVRSAWRIYAESLLPDQSKFVTALIQALEKYLSLLSPRDVDSAFHALEDLGVDLQDLPERYIEAAKPQIEAAAREDWPFEDFKSSALKPLIFEARSERKILPTIDAALERISIGRGWSDEDIQALDSCTEDELIDWMHSEPEHLSTKIRQGLLFLRGQSSDARYVAIGEKAVSALRRVARLSRLNAIRVTNMFGIDLQE